VLFPTAQILIRLTRHYGTCHVMCVGMMSQHVPVPIIVICLRKLPILFRLPSLRTASITLFFFRQR